MKKNKVLIISILVFAIIIILIGIILLNTNNSKTNKTNNNYKTFELNQDRVLKICNSEAICNNNIIYNKIIYNGNIQTIKKLVTKFNDKITKSYEKDKIYSEEDSCSTDNNVFFTHYDLNLYENAKFVSMTLESENYYYCQGKVEQEPLKETYIYSKKDKKFINVKEIKKQLGITNDQISYSINTAISYFNSNNNSDYTYENTFQNGKQDIKLFYSGTGKIYIHYISNEDNKYHLAELKEVD